MKTSTLTAKNFRRSCLPWVLAGLVFFTATVIAHQLTEQFIPIGQSPGISGQTSYIGRVQSLDPSNTSFILDSNRGIKTITLTPKTRIWLDRSKLKQTSIRAGFDDIAPGSRVEVKPDRAVDGRAEWIKIEAR